MTERTTVRLPADLVRRAKHRATAEGRSLTALIEDGLRHVVSERASASQARRIFPPVSVAMGGVAPGIDLNNSAALQELDDFEHVRRLR